MKNGIKAIGTRKEIRKYRHLGLGNKKAFRATVGIYRSKGIRIQGKLKEEGRGIGIKAIGTRKDIQKYRL